MRWCWLTALTIWMTVGQGPTVLAVGVGGSNGVNLDIFLVPHFFFFLPLSVTQLDIN